MKKKLILLAAAVLAAAAVTGCKAAGPKEESAGLPNPMKTVTEEEMASETGISLHAPKGAADVNYSVVDNGQSGKFAQVSFAYDGKKYNYRAEATGKLEAYDLSGMYFEWKDETDAKVNYCDAKVKLCDGAAVIYWLDIVPGIAYSLGCDGKCSSDDISKMAEQIFEPMQGDS